MHDQNPREGLSSTEFASLRQIAKGLGHDIPAQHRDVLLAVGLAQFDYVGRLTLTEVGARRFEPPSPPARRRPARPAPRAAGD